MLIVAAVSGTALVAPTAEASHNWWNSSYYSYFDISVSDSTPDPNQGLTITITYRQTYNGYSTFSGYYCCWSGRLWTSGPYHATSGTTRTVTVSMNAPGSAGTNDLHVLMLAASSAYPTPTYRNAYAHETITVQSPPPSVGTPTTPCVGEDHTGGGWSTHGSPHWTWGCSTASGGSINLWEVATSWGGSFTTGATDYHPTLGTGAHYVQVRARNNVGVWGGWSGQKWAYVDVTPPGVPSLSENHASTSGWTNHNHPNWFWNNPGDAGSGVAYFVGELDGGQFNLGGATSWHPTLGDGFHTFRVYAADGVGQRSAPSGAISVRIDTGPPVTSLVTGSPSVVVGGDRWITSATPISLSAVDPGCGVAQTLHAIDGGTPTAYSRPFTLAGPDGRRTVSYWSSDCAGNVEPAKSTVLSLDNTPPTVSLDRPAGGVLYVDERFEARYATAGVPVTEPIVVGRLVVRASAADAGVGMARVEFLVDGAVAHVATSAPYAFEWQAGDLAFGLHDLEARAVDRLGNSASTGGRVRTVPSTPDGSVATAEATTGADVPAVPEPDDLPSVPPDGLPQVPPGGSLPQIPPGGGLPQVPPVNVPSIPPVNPGQVPTVVPVFRAVADPASRSVTYTVGVMVNGQFIGVSGRVPPGG